MRQNTRKEKALFETPASSRARRLFFVRFSKKKKKIRGLFLRFFTLKGR